MINKRILLIYTGGTIGMVKDKLKKTLVPFNFDELLKAIPELKSEDVDLDTISIANPIDSSNMNTTVWAEIAKLIERNYKNYDGFVIMHGSDTMAYTASALSFILENLNKPVVFTGSQLPLGVLRTDGRENLLTAIEIAAANDEDTPMVPEVSIYFENHLMRGNRTTKYNAENFNAFVSGNLPLLAEVGVYIKYNKNIILKKKYIGIFCKKKPKNDSMLINKEKTTLKIFRKI